MQEYDWANEMTSIVAYTMRLWLREHAKSLTCGSVHEGNGYWSWQADLRLRGESELSWSFEP